ncbi:hypothetical protein CROQUDRAFT_55895 [Cronartium quercuum f. sp. fusiforme G11]|uniref:Uncharacterized protein n=1 Tax=Cronartium quercuum f. sp. fusiforme G11 TaxID=708437 RepID=A0A9P6NVY1_9BASI|nr:hypothetical protein CROQUDRAFT_55895 [Cronartium quercuum f. sp. fusiforme G11]
MRFSSFFALLACLALTKISIPATAMKFEGGSKAFEVSELSINEKQDYQGAEVVKIDMSKWIQVQMFSLLSTYADVLSKSVDKMNHFMGKAPTTQGGITFEYSIEIGKELDFILKFSYTTLNSLQQIGFNKMPDQLPEKIPEVADIAGILFKIGELLKGFWARASETDSPGYQKDCLPKLPKIAGCFVEIIKCCFKWIKALIPEVFKHFLPEFDDYNDIGLGLENIVKMLKSFYPNH